MGIKSAEIAGRCAQPVPSDAMAHAVARGAFAPIGFKLKYCLNQKLPARARSLDRAGLCLNAVTNRKYIEDESDVIRIDAESVGEGMNVMLAGSAAPCLVLDSRKESSVARSGGKALSRHDAIFVPHETQLGSGDFLNDAPSGWFAAIGVLSFSGTAGQREYHAEF